MSLIKILSQHELNMIDKWIELYGSSVQDKYNAKLNPEKKCSIEHALRFWNKNKIDLYHLLGNNLILEKTFTFNKTEEQMIESWNRAYCNCDELASFQDKILTAMIINRNIVATWSDNNFIAIKYYCFDTISLLHNCYQGNSMIIYPFGDNNKKESFKIEKGQKVMKILGKLAKIYQLIPEFEAFRLKHSQILNDSKISGTLCLSIHPMDFITMSDNDYNWDSCMSWKCNGCYRAGTIEMMNSNCVLVAYLKGNSPMKIDNDFLWDGNKKWRELIIVNPDVIVNIKSYPYQNQNTTLAALEWVRELAIVNNHWNFNYDYYEDYSIDSIITYHNDHKYSFDFYTNAMYNDFNTDFTCHYLYISEECEKGGASIPYSGELNCMYCGDIMNIYPEEDNTCCVICEDCQPNILCHECGEIIPYGEQEWVHDEVLCYHCFNNLCSCDGIYGDVYYNTELTKVYLIPYGDIFDEEYAEDYIDIKVPIEKIINNDDDYFNFNRNFNIDKIKSLTFNNEVIYYVNLDDLKEPGLYLYELYWKSDISKYLAKF